MQKENEQATDTTGPDALMRWQPLAGALRSRQTWARRQQDGFIPVAARFAPAIRHMQPPRPLERPEHSGRRQTAPPVPAVPAPGPAQLPSPATLETDSAWVVTPLPKRERVTVEDSHSIQGKRASAPSAPVDYQQPAYPARVTPMPAIQPLGAHADESAAVQAMVAHNRPLALDRRLTDFLSGIMRTQLPAVRIYANQEADRIVRRRRADAVTYGDNILFAAGKFDPRDPAGLGLLAHEMTHAALNAAQAERNPLGASMFVPREEERLARENEGLIRRQFSSPNLPPGSGLPFASPAPVVPDISTSRLSPESPMGKQGQPLPQQAPAANYPPPKAAPAARNLPAAPATADSGGSMALSAQQLKQIKDEVYRHLMKQIRIEFERGG